MIRRSPFLTRLMLPLAVVAAAGALSAIAQDGQQAKPPAAVTATTPATDTALKGTWSATGTLLESCTCAVPCTCNFGQGPSPNHFCHAVFAYRLDKAQWDGVDLSGLVVGGADGPDGVSGYVDTHATPEQRPALEKMGRAIFSQGGPQGGPRPFTSVDITHEKTGNKLHLDFVGKGGFTGVILMGRDRKTPIVVENNTTWPVARAIKGKASTLSFQDKGVGEVSGQGVNANYGTFSFTGRIPAARAQSASPARSVKTATATPHKMKATAPAKSCCARK
jgi:hypothetical protein